MVFIMDYDQIFRLIHWPFNAFEFSVNQLSESFISLLDINLVKPKVFVSLRPAFIQILDFTD